ncbi:dolichyl-diphosphooligosaccharide--protein glycosyltransferase subunit STT3B [Ischnura elegans]|uniref:dolichyl-diphosphooligosaccharide--protein glycosyltransferase subunit STT3B n=1 Tax=Ischnura elegans TaxID=197161 RepID=UPI001ED8AEC4|nr:dolichyl-diphosphooligosaccharide--protein glycosyltransferase subunit STT3B [Ischnura elegans]
MAAAVAAGKMKTSLSNPSGWKTLITVTVLLLAWISGFASRLFAVIRFESIIHEFDPWFNYRATAYMVKHGFYNFLNWFDERAWYPLGRIVGGTVYPGLMVTSGSIHYILHALNIPVHIRDICVFLAPTFSGLTAISTYLLGKELWSPGAGLFAACFMAIVPGYISRSVAGSYDNEGIAIFALQFTYYLWVKSVKTGSVFWASMTALSYFYMVSAWGGYVFIINLVPLHAFCLLMLGRFSARLHAAYSAFYVLGLLLSMQIPFVGFQPVRTSEHIASAGVFALLNAVALLKYVQRHLTGTDLRHFLAITSLIATAIVFLVVVLLTYLGVIAPWSGRFYSLWDTGYAKIHIPIIASVSEHQPTTWFSFLFDLHVLVPTFPAGLWHCIRDINDERVFVVLYALSAVYFAGVMVRLMLTLTPVVCILSGVAFSRLFELYLREEEGSSLDTKKGANSNTGAWLSGSGSAAVSLNARGAGLDDSDADDGNGKNGRNLYDKAGKPRRGRHDPQTSTPPGTPSSRRGGGDDSASSVATFHDTSSGGGLGLNIRSIVIVALLMLLMMFAVHCTWVTSNAYSSPSIVLASYAQDGSRQILDDFREAYHWLSQNTDVDAHIMSWWDYGYQIAGMANRTTLVDNNTWNNSHIALVGKAMSSNESAAYTIMTALDVDYVLVIFGGVIGYSGDDINKFLWMVRIAEGEHPKDIRESDYFTDRGEFRVDSEGTPTLLNSLMYKLSYYRFGELKLDYRTPAGFDRTRNAIIGNKNFDLTYLDEAYTTEHWLVRIYRVKKPHEFNRPRIPVSQRKIKRSKPFISKKSSRRRKGTLKNRPVVVKGRKGPAASSS